ncbi:hypothetical protein LZK73_10580 [Neorhizobium galegae]|nr:hypothetical protein LZK73_10580 [Neorhizobium galegae]
MPLPKTPFLCSNVRVTLAIVCLSALTLSGCTTTKKTADAMTPAPRTTAAASAKGIPGKGGTTASNRRADPAIPKAEAQSAQAPAATAPAAVPHRGKYLPAGACTATAGLDRGPCDAIDRRARRQRYDLFGEPADGCGRPIRQRPGSGQSAAAEFQRHHRQRLQHAASNARRSLRDRRSGHSFKLLI